MLFVSRVSRDGTAFLIFTNEGSGPRRQAAFTSPPAANTIARVGRCRGEGISAVREAPGGGGPTGASLHLRPLFIQVPVLDYSGAASSEAKAPSDSSPAFSPPGLPPR